MAESLSSELYYVIAKLGAEIDEVKANNPIDLKYLVMLEQRLNEHQERVAQLPDETANEEDDVNEW